MRIHIPALLLATGLAVSGCVLAAPRVGPNPYPPVPALQAETMPKPPISEDPLIWRPGYWDWTAGAYVWHPGAWIAKDDHGTNWQPGFWTRNAAGEWIWMQPHWL